VHDTVYRSSILCYIYRIQYTTSDQFILSLRSSSKTNWVKFLNYLILLIKFSYSIGLLTRITKSTRRHAQELIGNLHLIQEAYCHLNNFDFMNSNFANYLFNRFACHRKSDDSKHCQLGHLRKEDDSLVRLLFPFTQIKYYQTVHVGRILVKFDQFLPLMMVNLISLSHTSQILLHSIVKSMTRRILFTTIFFSQQLLNGVTFRLK
jgi:hypothetical protein